MARKKQKAEDKPPPGGWLGPPPTQGLKPLAIADGLDRKGNQKWKEIPQTKADRELRKEWQARMEKADRKGNYRFKWPPKKKED